MPPPSGAPHDAARRDWTALALACLGVAAFYAAVYGVRRIQVPMADDSFFYVWAVRFAGKFGLADSHLAARPAFPLIGSALGTVGGASPWLVVVTLPITMAVGLGLAGAAVAARWRLRGWALGLFVALASTSAVVARLVAGKTENLLTLWFIAAIIAVALWTDGRARLAAAVVLSFAAGLSEWPFVGVFLALVAVAAVAARLLGRRSEAPREDRVLESVFWAGLVGFVLALAVVSLWDRTGLGSVIQALPLDFAYRGRFRVEVAVVWPTVTFPLALVGWWASRRDGTESVRRVRMLLVLWLVGTGLALLVGWVGVHLPTYRALTFALPLALGVAAAPFAVRSLLSDPSRGHRAAGWLVGTGVAVVALIPATALWYRDFGGRASLDQIAEFAAAARFSLAQREPAVVVVDEPIDRVYFYRRIAADVLPAERRETLVVFTGTSRDALAGRPTLGADPARDALARSVFTEVRPFLESGAPVLTGRSLDQQGFAAARASGAPLIGGGAVAVLRGDPPRDQQSPITIVPVPHWWQVMLLAMWWLATLWAAGAGWSWAVMRRAPTIVRAAVAPALGGAALACITLVLVHLHVRDGGGGAVAAASIAVLASALAAAAALRAQAGKPA
jgi:hypothetical protein